MDTYEIIMMVMVILILVAVLSIKTMLSLVFNLVGGLFKGIMKIFK